MKIEITKDKDKINIHTEGIETIEEILLALSQASIAVLTHAPKGRIVKPPKGLPLDFNKAVAVRQGG